MPDIKEQLKALESYFVEKPPVCFGTLPVSASQCELFYGKQGSVIRRLNLATASQDELQALSDSCDKATFGLNHEDVHDESYRKAGKLDAADFAVRFNAVEAGLLDVVSAELFEGKKKKAPICAELYKLNVYASGRSTTTGEGSFFKPHLDTPRDKTMFGSLVITFPTAHVGGLLVFRHEGKEWSVDSGKLNAEQAELSAVYAAFYSDVEHEVLPVRKGYRVTVTYNLYFVSQVPEFCKPVGHAVHVHGSALRTAFAAVLADPTFLPKGGYLGFGLRHQYPLDKSGDIEGEEDMAIDEEEGSADKEAEVQETMPPSWFVPGPQLKALEQYLKGGDAMLKQVCDELKLRIFLGVVYRDEDEHDVTDIVCPRVVDLEDPDYRALGPDGSIDSETFCDWLRRYYGGKVLPNKGWYQEPGLEVEWVTDSPRANFVRQKYMIWGNEAQKAYTYFRVCLFATVGAAGSRETASG